MSSITVLPDMAPARPRPSPRDFSAFSSLSRAVMRSICFSTGPIVPVSESAERKPKPAPRAVTNSLVSLFSVGSSALAIEIPAADEVVLSLSRLSLNSAAAFAVSALINPPRRSISSPSASMPARPCARNGTITPPSLAPNSSAARADRSVPSGSRAKASARSSSTALAGRICLVVVSSTLTPSRLNFAIADSDPPAAATISPDSACSDFPSCSDSTPESLAAYCRRPRFSTEMPVRSLISLSASAASMMLLV